MRKYGRIDANHAAVVAALLKLGCIVVSTASVGGGFPDLCVGWRGLTVLMEVKDGMKPPSARALTDDQKRFHERWPGADLIVVTCPGEAVIFMIARDALRSER